MRHAFEELKMNALWCGYFADNEHSFKAEAKYSLKHYHMEEKQFSQFMSDDHIEHISRIGKDEWLD